VPGTQKRILDPGPGRGTIECAVFPRGFYPSRRTELSVPVPAETGVSPVVQNGLEKDGLISRKVFPVVPPKVEYELTIKGKSLEKILRSLDTWGREMSST
jgi:hypothetical protein